MNPAVPTKRQTVNPAQVLLIAALQGYRLLVSPALGALFGPTGGCRFTPTCSAYALEAVRAHGAVRGSVLALRRLARCHPWGDCGHDPVPPPAPPASVAAPAGAPTGGCLG